MSCSSWIFNQWFEFYSFYRHFSINKISIEFRTTLELFERTSSLMAKIELDEQIIQGEKILQEFKQQFDSIFNKKLHEFNDEKQQIFELLRPTFGHPAKKSDLQILDNREKIREDEAEKVINELRFNTIVKNYS